jgi:ribosome-associated protein
MNQYTIPQSKDLTQEIIFFASRSGGPGGQHVNKVSTKITLKWDVIHSMALNEEQKSNLSKKLAHYLTKEGILLLSSASSRSQLQNRKSVLSKLDRLLVSAFTPRKIRKATKPGKVARRKRIQEKKLRSEKKQWRQKPV